MVQSSLKTPTQASSQFHHQKKKPKLEVCNLNKNFNQQHKQLAVLKNINFQLYESEFVCVVGASGCGKSTLINIIAGLIQPTSGEVKVDGGIVLGPGSDRGMVFQNYTLYPWLTVAGNIGFGSRLRSLCAKQRKERIAYFLEVVGLTRFAKAYPQQLSGGMKQRVAIARALANEPDVLLMDEPFGALDAQTKEQMQQFLLNLWQQTHTTIWMITHDVEEAVFLSQRVFVMSSNPGEIKQEIAIDLPQDRDVEMKLTPEFTAIKRKVMHCLRDC
ncbi:ABC transporter ATP-binding protein [Gloeocapsopsis crepidinum LEGE 06123]|uniref:ABC transporter ATP-binding protein n=1 Tax=Gloeocapsopsis crepidinum LEGE 06123 TaxID=588587 RepID=A0ABR9ULX4_9CHRO|nr:ABC transporter ATP-binding protein [Gloeocapsopsis crepidinum]MBE9189270.1 ABC transporter ATP-binding protein [Gloeocapsopsis crepidinum LEGE 06123]